MLSKAGVALPGFVLAIAPAIVIGLVAGAVIKERSSTSVGSGALQRLGV